MKKSGVYRLTCPDCQKKYVGQTERSFKKRYKEHFHDFKYNIHRSRFATHLLENKHSMGPINEVMELVYTTSKGKFVDTVERFYIYSETRGNNQINDKNKLNPTLFMTSSVPMIPHRTPTD